MIYITFISHDVFMRYLFSYRSSQIKAMDTDKSNPKLVAVYTDLLYNPRWAIQYLFKQILYSLSIVSYYPFE